VNFFILLNHAINSQVYMQNWGMILTGETEVLRNKSVQLALCPSQIDLGSNCRLRGDSRNTRRSPQCPG